MLLYTPTCYTAVQLNSHHDIIVPPPWFDSQPCRCQWRLQVVPHDCVVPIRITTENLKSKTSETFHTRLVEINRFFASIPIARADSSIIVTMMKIDDNNFGNVTIRRVGRVIVSLSRCFNSLFQFVLVCLTCDKKNRNQTQKLNQNYKRSSTFSGV